MDVDLWTESFATIQQKTVNDYCKVLPLRDLRGSWLCLSITLNSISSIPRGQELFFLKYHYHLNM